jgi:hypothetical protein
MTRAPTVDELFIAAGPDAWAAAGFDLLGDLCEVGTARLRLEVVQAPARTKVAADPNGPVRLWGISFLVEELATPAAARGDSLGEPRDAVQPGRRIATVATAAGLGPAIAFMTPGPGAV